MDRHLANLPKLSPSEAHLRQVVPAALTGQPCGEGARLVASFPALVPAQTAWFDCANGLAFAVEMMAGQPVRLGPDDGIAAAEILDVLEPALRAIEAALGIELEPEDLTTAPSQGGLIARIETVAEGTPRDRLYLALAPDQPVLPAAPVRAPELLGHVPVPVQVRIAGPRIRPHEGADLGPGDLLLLGPGPLGAELRALDQPARTGRFDPGARSFFVPRADLEEEPRP
jgi:hypothetical protein